MCSDSGLIVQSGAASAPRRTLTWIENTNPMIVAISVASDSTGTAAILQLRLLRQL
jgi:hypothetical protein